MGRQRERFQEKNNKEHSLYRGPFNRGRKKHKRREEAGGLGFRVSTDFVKIPARDERVGL